MLPVRRIAIPMLLAALLPWTGVVAATTPHPQADQFRAWIVEMKESPRGPFRRIRWFCRDGSVLPPKAYACSERGGGVQHGEWSSKTLSIREAGYKIANILADLDVESFLAAPDHVDSYNQILLEQFLIGVDDGWILRRARFYRGALQSEDEAAGARSLLTALADRPEWLGQRYLGLRAGVKLLAHGEEQPSAVKIRQDSAALAKQDPPFMDLRNKIHGKPEYADAAAVRGYARSRGPAELADAYEELALEIEAVYGAPPPAEALDAFLRQAGGGGDLARELGAVRPGLEGGASPTQRLQAAGAGLLAIRDSLGDLKPSRRLAAMDLSLRLESSFFQAASELGPAVASATRGQRLAWLRAAADAAYGVGFMSADEYRQLLRGFDSLAADSVPLPTYKQALDDLARLPGWGSQWLRFQFGDSMTTLAAVEPLSVTFVDDQLRGSPLLFYSQVLESLAGDANRLAGVRQELFGEQVGAGLRSLNPGLARGTLRLILDGPVPADLDPQAIYVLPETVHDLSPVAGILTAGEGNPLSHVQLLARNLGIPNVRVDVALLPRLQQHAGSSVVLAASAAGSVVLDLDRGQWQAAFDDPEVGQDFLIRPDMERLDLDYRRLTPLSDLRASDSGRTVGPKAAKLGELHHAYPERVAAGLAIPFGVFRQLLEQPMPGEQGSVFEWMSREYDAIGAMPEGSRERRDYTEAFRERLYQWVLQADPGPEFKARLREAMEAEFGRDGSYGVFVRSDTNVEDLPGFTGAGLNLTVFNVVGFDDVWQALSRVWASPFTARAFAWRQSHMEDPEHVYPAVLLLRSVASDKSGVLVTQDLDTGSDQWLSVAINEGVGGAVDGQAAESVRIDRRTGQVRLLASATAASRKVVDTAGGIRTEPVTGGGQLVGPAEAKALIALADSLPERFPPIVDAQGRPAPADIEFGFLDGKLWLFQLRPFLESDQARSSAALQELDSDLQLDDSVQVRLDQ